MTSAPADSDLWIRRFRPAPDRRVQLVCFPHAGGSASFYFPVSESLAPSVEVLSIQYPGRQDRRTERCIEDIPLMADHIANALRFRIAAPLVFFGHSMGAVIAYEVALRLEQRDGTGLVTLFASGRRAPSRHRDEALHTQGDASIIAELRALSGTNEMLLGDDELLAMIMPALRGDYRAIERYRHQPGSVLGCPISALVGASDPRTTIEEAEAWREHTTGQFQLTVFPGGHFYLLDVASDVIKLIAEALAPHLATPQSAQGPVR